VKDKLETMDKADYDETKSTSSLVDFQLSSPVHKITMTQITDLQKIVGERRTFQFNPARQQHRCC
jgi:hypothetical protein